ncbi:MAG TPA: DUF2505 domain-containing protein [Mycobacterium sp.]|nr:DUF2505 domain-containing protein [Mycobacterium sp.]
MARSFHVHFDSSAELGDVFAAFCDRSYWEARLATFSNGTAALGALDVDGEGTVTVDVTLRLLKDRLPRVVTQLRSGDLEMRRRESWHVGEDGLLRGDVAATMSGAPFSLTGRAVIDPTDHGSKLSYDATVEVRIPLVGGRIESYIAAQAGDEVGAIHRFTGDWIASNS